VTKSKLSQAYEIYRTNGIDSLFTSVKTHISNSTSCGWKKSKYRMQWGAARPTPTDLIYVDPDEIVYCAPTLTGPEYDLNRHCCHVVDGDWDTDKGFDGWIYKRQFSNKPNITEPQLISFDQYVFYDSLKQHFLDDVSWKDTKMYRWAIENLCASSRYDCEGDVIKWLRGIDDLYDYIDDNGFLSQRELVANGVLEKSTPFPEYNEVHVNITRNGEFVLGINGRHRTSIAKILDLEEIPVRVFSRHRLWQEVRYKHYSLSVSKVPERIRSYHSHPDVKALIE